MKRRFICIKTWETISIESLVTLEFEDNEFVTISYRSLGFELNKVGIEEFGIHIDEHKILKGKFFEHFSEAFEV
jgi:hypothetical protein